MKYLAESLLEDIFAQSEQNINKAITEWQQLPAEFFTAQPGFNKWSGVQCLEHLNSYGRYYLPAIEKAIAMAANTNPGVYFSSGWLGNYFYKLMLTDSTGNAKKMKAPKNHRPPAQLNLAKVMEEFISQQEKLGQLITLSRSIDIARAKVPISIAPVIQLKLGDTFLFYTAHINRHVMQAEKALQVAGYSGVLTN